MRSEREVAPSSLAGRGANLDAEEGDGREKSARARA